ncbi:MAG: peptidase MA domain-containing protein [Chloroflexi bacterium]|nr:peptidase MA domain-containing protein [Chloroflexota bacterium]
MKKKIAILTILICLSLSAFAPVLVHAQITIKLQSSSVQADFPSKLTFNLSAKDDVNLTDIRLRYTINRESFAQAFSEAYVAFTPAATVSVNWVLNMQKIGGLPPGATVKYWWVIKDAAGNRLETAPQQIDFNDSRHLWRNVSKGTLTLYWYQGDDAFVNQLMTAAQQGLASLEKNTGAQLVRPVRIYIYASARDLQGSMVFPAEWTGGVSFTEYGIIAIGIAPSNLDWGLRAITHELTHLVIHQMTFNPYNGLPTWLDEGLAVYNEGPPDPTFTALLNQAIADNQLTSVRSLSSPFSAYGDEATLSYAESYSVVNYLITTYGQPKMLELLNTFQQGSTYDGAFQEVYGFNMDGLYTLWKQQVIPKRASRLEPVTPSFPVRFGLALQGLMPLWGVS